MASHRIPACSSAQQRALTSDIFVEEVFPTLLAGGCIDMVPKQVLLSEETLRRVLKEDAVTHLT